MSTQHKSACRAGDPARDEVCARVISVFGPRLLVETEGRRQFQCLLGSRKLRPVCGDRVQCRLPTEKAEGVITGLLPRRSELRRPDRRGRPEVLAANVTQLVIVSAVTPAWDPFLVDRYLVAAESMSAAAVGVFNKIDMLNTDAAAPPTELDEYASLGYTVIRSSVRTGAGITDLTSALAGQTSILVGQSGVGKSSLLNVILPAAEAATRAVSKGTGMGRHTTTASVLYHLRGGGELIDSPGVRDFTPPPLADRDIDTGFVEFKMPARNCRFNDCMHLEEPGCGVKAAVTDGKIGQRRYESYRRMVRLMRELAEKTKPK